jgi:hypothetical protein
MKQSPNLQKLLTRDTLRELAGDKVFQLGSMARHTRLPGGRTGCTTSTPDVAISLDYLRKEFKRKRNFIKLLDRFAEESASQESHHA